MECYYVLAHLWPKICACFVGSIYIRFRHHNIVLDVIVICVSLKIVFIELILFLISYFIIDLHNSKFGSKNLYQRCVGRLCSQKCVAAHLKWKRDAKSKSKQKKWRCVIRSYDYKEIFAGSGIVTSRERTWCNWQTPVLWAALNARVCVVWNNPVPYQEPPTTAYAAANRCDDEHCIVKHVSAYFARKWI